VLCGFLGGVNNNLPQLLVASLTQVSLVSKSLYLTRIFKIYKGIF